jgi:hypothetical protein
MKAWLPTAIAAIALGLTPQALRNAIKRKSARYMWRETNHAKGGSRSGGIAYEVLTELSADQYCDLCAQYGREFETEGGNNGNRQSDYASKAQVCEGLRAVHQSQNEAKAKFGVEPVASKCGDYGVLPAAQRERADRISKNENTNANRMVQTIQQNGGDRIQIAEASNVEPRDAHYGWLPNLAAEADQEGRSYPAVESISGGANAHRLLQSAMATARSEGDQSGRERRRGDAPKGSGTSGLVRLPSETNRRLVLAKEKVDANGTRNYEIERGDSGGQGGTPSGADYQQSGAAGSNADWDQRGQLALARQISAIGASDNLLEQTRAVADNKCDGKARASSDCAKGGAATTDAVLDEGFTLGTNNVPNLKSLDDQNRLTANEPACQTACDEAVIGAAENEVTPNLDDPSLAIADQDYNKAQIRAELIIAYRSLVSSGVKKPANAIAQIARSRHGIEVSAHQLRRWNTRFNGKIESLLDLRGKTNAGRSKLSDWQKTYILDCFRKSAGAATMRQLHRDLLEEMDRRGEIDFIAVLHKDAPLPFSFHAIANFVESYYQKNQLELRVLRRGVDKAAGDTEPAFGRRAEWAQYRGQIMEVDSSPFDAAVTIDGKQARPHIIMFGAFR